MDINIGTKFIRRGTKRKDIETVVDIYTKKNSKGEIVKITYLAEHDFLGQTIHDEVVKATIVMGKVISNEETQGAK